MGGLRRVDKACNIRPTAKARTLLRKKNSGRCSGRTGKSSLLIPSEGEGEDEEEATISLLAYENHCLEKDIHVMLEMR